MGDCTRVSRWCAVVCTWLASEWANGIWRVCTIDRAHACICVRDSASVCVRLHVCLRPLTCLCACVRARACVKACVRCRAERRCLRSCLGAGQRRRVVHHARHLARERALRVPFPRVHLSGRGATCSTQHATRNTQRATRSVLRGHTGRPSPGLDVAGASPVLRQMWQRWLGSDTSCSRITSAISVGECRAWRKHSELRLRSHRASPGRRYHRIDPYVRTGYA